MDTSIATASLKKRLLSDRQMWAQLENDLVDTWIKEAESIPNNFSTFLSVFKEKKSNENWVESFSHLPKSTFSKIESVIRDIGGQALLNMFMEAGIQFEKSPSQSAPIADAQPTNCVVRNKKEKSVKEVDIEDHSHKDEGGAASLFTLATNAANRLDVSQPAKKKRKMNPVGADTIQVPTVHKSERLQAKAIERQAALAMVGLVFEPPKKRKKNPKRSLAKDKPVKLSAATKVLASKTSTKSTVTKTPTSKAVSVKSTPVKTSQVKTLQNNVRGEKTSQKRTKMRVLERSERTPWCEEESGMLTALYKAGLSWADIARKLNQKFGNNRLAFQCGQRYRRVQNPELMKKRWSFAEEEILMQKCTERPGQWAWLTAFVPNRPDVQLRYHFKKLSESLMPTKWTKKLKSMLLEVVEEWKKENKDAESIDWDNISAYFHKSGMFRSLSYPYTLHTIYKSLQLL